MYGRQDIFCDLRRFPACSSECQEPAPKQVVNTAQYLLVVSKGTYKSQGSTHVAVPTNTALVVDFITQLIRVANASIEPEKMTAFQTRVMCIHSSMKHGTTKWKQFQDVAKQFQGGSLKPNRKLLPSAVHTVANIDSPSTLAALMHQEKIAHDDPNHEYHYGGGVFETAGSIFSALWGMTGKAAYNLRWLESRTTAPPLCEQFHQQTTWMYLSPA